MRARLKQDVVRGNRVYPRGLECELLESFYTYRLDVGDGVVLEVWGNLVRIGCEVPDCTREATHDSPRHWCKVHWDQWINHDGEEEEPEWMNLEDEGGWEPSDAYKEQCETYGDIEGRAEKIAELVREIQDSRMPEERERVLRLLATVSERLTTGERRALRTLRASLLEHAAMTAVRSQNLLDATAEIDELHGAFACPDLRKMGLVEILHESQVPAVIKKKGAPLGTVSEMLVYVVRPAGPATLMVLAGSLEDPRTGR